MAISHIAFGKVHSSRKFVVELPFTSWETGRDKREMGSIWQSQCHPEEHSPMSSLPSFHHLPFEGWNLAFNQHSFRDTAGTNCVGRFALGSGQSL